VAHDLSVVRHIGRPGGGHVPRAHREIGTVERVFDAPAHPYTQALLSAIPSPTPPGAGAAAHHPGRRPAQPGRSAFRLPVPHPVPLFATLSPEKAQRCIDEEPVPYPQGGDHAAACHYAEARAVI